MTPVERARRRILVFSVPGGFLATTGAAVNITTTLAEPSQADALYAVGITSGAVGLLMATVPYYRWRMAMRDEEEQSEALTEERLRSTGLREALDDLERLLDQRDREADEAKAEAQRIQAEFSARLAKRNLDPETPFRLRYRTESVEHHPDGSATFHLKPESPQDVPEAPPT